jgi:PAS domain S-box-containing protein
MSDIHYLKERLMQQMETLQDTADKIEQLKSHVNEIIRISNLQRDFYKILAENSVDMVAILDEEYIIRYVNPATLSILGYTTEEIFDKPIYDFIHFDDLQRLEQQFEKLLNYSDSPYTTMNFRFRLRNDDWAAVEAVVKNLRSEEQLAGIYLQAHVIQNFN